ncbi:MAG: MFS transporter [Bacteroidales bacterium]|nr:MFS transporter [Bacteroidales bacterium]MCF8391097.1 MFS transporter [Bacteroidales bacterium]
MNSLLRNVQYYKFCAYGFLKNFRFFDAFLILFLLEKELPYTQIGLLYASREISIYIFEIPSGIIADSFGRKNSLVGSFIGYILSFALFYISSDFWLLLMAFVLYGIGDSFRSGTHKGMIMDYLKMNHWEDQKINYYGHTRSWSQLGSAVSSLIAGLIVFYTGKYQSIFLFSIIPYLFNLILIISYPKELNGSGSVKNTENRLGFILILKSFYLSMKQVRVLKIINTSALHSAFLKSVKDYIQPVMVHVALLIPVFLSVESEKKTGLLIGVFYFIIYVLTSNASRIASGIASKRMKTISHISIVIGFLSGILCGIFFYYEWWFFSLIAFVGIFVIENIRKPVLTGIIADNVPNEILTSVISAQSQLSGIMAAILAVVFGILADKYNIGISFIIISGILFFAAILANSLKARFVDQSGKKI